METIKKANEKPEFTFTMAYKESKNGNGFFGIIKEVPGAASQGKTIADLKENLLDAVHCIFNSNKNSKNESIVTDN